MKINAIIRIILWSVIALILSAVLLGVLNGYRGARPFSLADFFRNSLVLNSGIDENYEYPEGSSALPWETVHKIEVDWVSGGVQVQVYDGNEITFEAEGVDIEEVLCYSLQDGKLTIRSGDKQQKWNLFFSSEDKNLQLKLPQALLEQLYEIEIETASGAIRVADVQAEEIAAESVSGDIEMANVVAQTLELGSVSGKVVCINSEAEQLKAENTSGIVRLQGNFKKVKAESVSGEIYLEAAVAPQKFDGCSVSGEIILSLAAMPGFTADVDTVSGSFVSDYPTLSQKSNKVYGDGSCEYDFETVSGNIYIKKQG